ncbi:YcfA-like protein [Chryseobacterium oranimense G311]|uniref:type II toxin-antitoxin system HicA family toxin n=1 Tax=Chryseobacterium oranimense TaxID=421058 RepID=UPI0005336DDB|nr:type II toxin-antitoxin system HicA family toxin [Chryseobacterium oranimense]CEJ71245.1 YcfA-like protein [Chryseobacterium oranimense G311]DAG72819.1 MAG TPA: toxin [Caudoviricetes sp.]
MKSNQMVKILKKDGWELLRHGKKHDLYVHPTKDGAIPIPRHPATELKKGTEESILKAAGLK